MLFVSDLFFMVIAVSRNNIFHCVKRSLPFPLYRRKFTTARDVFKRTRAEVAQIRLIHQEMEFCYGAGSTCHYSWLK